MVYLCCAFKVVTSIHTGSNVKIKDGIVDMYIPNYKRGSKSLRFGANFVKKLQL